jgi:ribose/xylose/arabinose/galactoside ABC-type transport system permease subunit
VAGTLVLTYTPLGRYILAAGGNEQAARLSGIPVDRVKIAVYAISGLLAGLAGVLWASYESTADPQNDGLYFELSTIAAVVIGGTSLLGGRGSVWRTLVGALIITVLNALLIQMGRDLPDQLIAQGLIIVGAVMLQRTRD